MTAMPAAGRTSGARPGGGTAPRTTRQGAALEGALRAVDGFRTAQQLHAELHRRGEAVGLATVYRRLRAMADAGEVDVVQGADGEAQYRLCPPPAGPGTAHHHHLVCRACGRSVEVEGPEVEAWADRVAREHGYVEVSHTLEVFGLCPEHAAPVPRRPARRR